VGLLSFSFLGLLGLLVVLDRVESENAWAAKALFCAQQGMEELRFQAAQGKRIQRQDTNRISSGVFLGLTFSFTPVSGMSFLIIALGVVVLGGMGSIVGTFVGGVAFGLAQTLGGYFFGVAAQMLVAYIMVLVVLAVIPRGIFGR